MIDTVVCLVDFFVVDVAVFFVVVVVVVLVVNCSSSRRYQLTLTPSLPLSLALTLALILTNQDISPTVSRQQRHRTLDKLFETTG